MTGSFLSAWVLFPLLLLVVCTGLGLLVRRLSGSVVSGVLVLPLGFALAVSLCTLGTSVTWLAPATGWITLALAVVGIVLERRTFEFGRRPARGTLFAGAAGAVAFAAYGAPVFLTGTPSWTGYARIVDTAFQMAFAQHLAEAGRQVPVVNSSFTETIQGLTANGYPGGAQATLGALANVIRTDVVWCYQSYQAWSAAMGALALYALLRLVIRNALLCCIAAAIAIQANVLYDYSLEGGIKELTTAALLLLAAAVLAEWLAHKRRPLSAGLALAPAVAGAAAAFSYGIAPWLGLLVLAAFALSLIPRGRLRTVAAWGLTAVATAVLAVPTVISSIKLFGTAKEAVTGTVEVGLGNLTAPMPEISALGVWISNDYRFPMLAKQSVSHAFDIGVIVLIVAGVICALWRRRWMLAAFGVAAPIALAYVVAHSGPWVSLKAYAITATMFLATAFIGAGWLATARAGRITTPVRVIGWVGALVLAGAVLYGNALTYHDISLAPASRYTQLASIGKRFAGVGPAFFPAFDEYSEYFLRREKGYDLVRPPGLQVRPGAVQLAPGQFAYAYDLNQLELGFVERFPLIVQPRSPFGSRAPANFDLVDRTPEFDVWRRDRPASEVIVHLPLSGSPIERTPVFCRGLLAQLHRAGPGAMVAYAPSGPRVVLLPPQAQHPSYWHALGPEVVRAYGAGEISGPFSVPTSGTYEIAMQGSVGRPLTLYIDGRRVGGVAYQERYPAQYLHLARVRLAAGAHALRLTRPNGGLHPGSGDGPDPASGLIGPIVFTLQLPSNGSLTTVPASRAAAVCAARVPYQWMEVVRPRASASSS